MKKNTKNAFTLIELLVVIAIIGLLATLVAPSVGVAKKRASSTKCIAGMKQIGSALVLYAVDSQQYYPAVSIENPNGSGSISWSKTLDPYLPQRGNSVTAPEHEIFICPSAKYKGFLNHNISRSYSACGSMFGNGGGTAKIARAMSSISVPQESLLFVDALNQAPSGASYASSGSGIANSQFEAEQSKSSIEGMEYFDFRHNEKMNVMYADFHVSSMSLSELQALTRQEYLGVSL